MKSLPILDEKATGIDVGSEHFHVSIAGGKPKVFGTMTRDVDAVVQHLQEHGVRTVAMEATGVYWMCLYAGLTAAGMEVLVVNGRHVRNVPGRKTDMADCQWLATLHAHGLLTSGFVPTAQIRQLQDYMRLREDHVRKAATEIQLMQKALERMNVKLHNQLTDLSGASGMKVLRAIIDGETDPHKLLALCDVQIRKNKAERVVESLRGTWSEEHVFRLRQAVNTWDFVMQQIRECDVEIERVLRDMGAPPDDQGKAGRGKPANAKTPQIAGLHRILVSMCGGQDPTKLPGIGDHNLLKLISEVGTDLMKWANEHRFTSWLGLAPGTAQSGKRRKNQSRQANHAGRIFLDIARSASNSLDSGLAAFYRRLKARRGGLIAMKALARKIAALYWRVMVHGTDYVEEGQKRYQERALLSEQRRLAKLAHKHGMQLVPQPASTA